MSNEIIVHDDYGLGIIASNTHDLHLFEDFCRTNFLPISKEHCFVASACDQTMIDRYLLTGIDHVHLEYAMIILLRYVEYTQLSSFIYPQQLSIQTKVYNYSLQILIENVDQSNDEFLTIIRSRLLGEQFIDDHDDHASVPSWPSPRQPQFVSIFPSIEIACWPMIRRRDLKRFRQDLGVTHVLTLLNDNEVNQTNICQQIQSAGMISLHIPIDGADLSVYTSSKRTRDILIERMPSILDLLLRRTHETQPIKMLIHCSAGLHRTGTIAYVILRLCHFTMDQALLIIHRTRAITARQVAKKRIDAAETYLLGNIL
jgi:protein-tyrosine phosphatase